MQALGIIEIFQQLCEIRQRWGLYISFDLESVDEPNDIFKAAPYLEYDKHAEILDGNRGIFLFDAEEEMEKYYNQTVGPDGPTEVNSYNGDCIVYALTCDPNGNMLSENT